MHSNLIEQPPTLDDIMVKRLLMKDHLISNLDQFSMPEVSVLYNRWREAPDVIRDFEFRELILTQAFKAFRAESLYQWMVFQNKTANLTDLHIAFIASIVSFIHTGHRDTHVSQWMRLIEHTRHPQYRKIDLETLQLVPGTIVDLIQQWVSWPSGFEDLLLTLYVIFGDHPYITNVREKDV
jgi:hypothetical protein